VVAPLLLLSGAAASVLSGMWLHAESPSMTAIAITRIRVFFINCSPLELVLFYAYKKSSPDAIIVRLLSIA
jgi:hypothetical protein